MVNLKSQSCIINENRLGYRKKKLNECNRTVSADEIFNSVSTTEEDCSNSYRFLKSNLNNFIYPQLARNFVLQFKH